MSLLPTYIQVGSNACININNRFGIYLQHGTLINFPEPKNVWVHDWIDSDGEDLYVPNELYYKPYDLDLDFVYIGERDSFNDVMRDFILYLGAGEFSIFDVWQKAGLRLRYIKYKEGDKYREDRDIWQFTITFRVSKPSSYGIYFPYNEAKTIIVDTASIIYASDGSKVNRGAGESYTATSHEPYGGFVIVEPKYQAQDSSIDSGGGDIIDPTA